MKLSEQAVHRPIFTTMVVIIVIILGGMALTRLPVDLMPDITSPTISISTDYSNASPEEIEEMVTRPIEEAVSATTGVQEISSSSTEGSSSVRVTFNWGTNLDTASNDLRDRLDRITSSLPDDCDRPILRKFDMASTPVLVLGVTSKLPPLELRKVVDDEVSYRLERVPGVASVDVRGGLTREIHVNLDPGKIQALHLSLNTIAVKIKASNLNLPAGSVYIGNNDVTVRTPGEFNNLDDLRNTVVADRDGALITLGEIAGVEDSSVKITRVIRINGQPGLQLSINKQSGTNTVSVAKGVLKELANINRDMSQLQLVPLIDSSVYIRQSINNVASSAVMGGILAIMILLLFLRNLKSTLIISTAIPISIIATFGLVYFCGFTLNMMTLGGLALGVGMLLDNSIVVLENIYRLRENGQKPLEAAVNGTNEVAAPIIASTVTTIVVFLPLIFMQGVSGIMFKQLAYVIAFSIFCSLATALTLVPMLSGRLLTVNRQEDRPNRLSLFFNRVGIYFSELENRYKRLLHWSLGHRSKVLAVVLALFMLCIILYPFIGKELMPATDEGELRVDVQMAVGTKLDITATAMLKAEKIITQAVPEIKNLISTAGSSGGYGGSSLSNTGQFRISLVPRSDRKRSSDEICQVLRKRLSGIPGATFRVRSTSSTMVTRVLSSGAGSLELDIRGHDFATADKLAQQVKKAMESVKGVTDINISRSAGAPERQIVVDRRKAASLGLTVSDVANMLETVLSGTSVGQYRDNGDEYTIRMQVNDASDLPLDQLLDLTIVNSDGQAIVLRSVVDEVETQGSTEIDRLNQERYVSISANVSGRSQSKVMDDIRAQLREISIPKDFTVDFGGDYDDQQKSYRDLMMGFLLSLILVYMVMACQYESLRDPLVVMFSVPLAVIGVVLMLFLTKTTFNLQSYMGCIMLGGIVVNNAILLVDTTNLLRRRDGMELHAAVEEAGRRRLRPILMTALTSMLGLVPMAIGTGEGGEAQAPLARAVVGGLLSSTLITLLVIPIVYSIFEEKLRKRDM